jgi:hypothetical protein
MTMMATCLGDVMDNQQRQKPFGKATAVPLTPLQRLASRALAGPPYEEPARRPGESQDHLKSLEVWVCELLIKNQQLRMALESATAQAEERPDG